MTEVERSLTVLFLELPEAVAQGHAAIVRKAISRLEEESERRRAILERSYHAGMKPAHEEGECWDEVASDIRWEAIDGPALSRGHRES